MEININQMTREQYESLYEQMRGTYFNIPNWRLLPYEGSNVHREHILAKHSMLKIYSMMIYHLPQKITKIRCPLDYDSCFKDYSYVINEIKNEMKLDILYKICNLYAEIHSVENEANKYLEYKKELLNFRDEFKRTLQVAYYVLQQYKSLKDENYYFHEIETPNLNNKIIDLYNWFTDNEKTSKFKFFINQINDLIINAQLLFDLTYGEKNIIEAHIEKLKNNLE